MKARDRARHLGALLAACLGTLGACGEPVSLGSPDSRDDQVQQSPTAPKNPCEDQPCGSPCTGALGQAGLCDGAGTCAPSVICSAPWPCAGKPCGEPCSPCAEDEPGCDPPQEPTWCDALGECVSGMPLCEAWQPCLEQPCGTPCEPCNPTDAGCIAPDTLFVCGAFGECTLPEQVFGCSVAFEACDGAAHCGDPCVVCDLSQGNCAATPGLFCTGPFGSCVDHLDACEQLDCVAGNLACGDQCGFCPPEDPSCMPAFCDAGGACVPAPMVACGGGAPGCDGVSCGALCTLCDWASSSCDDQAVFLFCDGPYGCTDAPTCTYAPCGGKVCGEWCSDECDPYDTSNCMPAQIKTCNAVGECVDEAFVGCE